MPGSFDILTQQALALVDRQLAEQQPPLTTHTLARLLDMGYSHAQARELISICVLMELMEVMRTDEPFDLARYQQWLERLPELPG